MRNHVKDNSQFHNRMRQEVDYFFWKFRSFEVACKIKKQPIISQMNIHTTQSAYQYYQIKFNEK